MALIKDIYSPAFYDSFADTLTQTIPGFSKGKFISDIYSSRFAELEWKERVKHTTAVLHGFLPVHFPDAIGLLEKTIGKLRENGAGNGNLVYIFFADYISAYGLEDLGTSVRALEFVTQFISCEFAVRPFLLRYEQQMLAEMLRWSVHESADVRRLASEGSRPRLPWGMAIPSFKKDPSPVLPILENLRKDSSETVRRSVANNLNDIAKDNPQVVISVAKRWKGQSRETDAVVRHGSRTLLKQGNPEILKLYGLDSGNIHLHDFEIHTPQVKIGDALEFSIGIGNQNGEQRDVRLEYGIYYLKAKGQLARKVFKLGERILEAGEQVTLSRKQSFKVITTRVFYPGMHRISIIINGEEKGIKDFHLKE